MPLPYAPIGEEMRVCRVIADDKVKRHLEDMGFTRGARLTALSASGGNVVVRLGESRLALDRSVAIRIFIER